MNEPAPPDITDRSAPKISFVSLGCPKALVDSERIITRLRAEGYELTRSHTGADAVVVNTCGFLDSAKAESLEAIRAAMAENGKVIVTGCMGAEPGPIRENFPDILAITGPQAYENVVAAVHSAVPPAHDPFLDLLPREIGGRPAMHALEVRHESFACPQFVDLARKHGAAIVTACDSDYPEIVEATSSFAYLRVMGTQEKAKLGYAPKALDSWAARAKALAGGKPPRDVFFYFISGFKERNPLAAAALIERLR